MKLLHKIKDKKGETIVEVLCAVLVAGIAVELLFSCIVMSNNMAQKARKADEEVMTSIEKAEVQSSTDAKTGLEITISYETEPDTEEFSIKAYGDNDIYSYKK